MNRMLSAPAGQDHSLHLSDVQRGLLERPESQREALILVGAGGFSYEEAAEICGCAVGTVKSRVARARVALEKIITEGGFSEATAGANLSDPHAAILAPVARLSAGPAQPPARSQTKSEERRVGKACVQTCKSRW